MDALFSTEFLKNVSEYGFNAVLVIILLVSNSRQNKRMFDVVIKNTIAFVELKQVLSKCQKAEPVAKHPKNKNADCLDSISIL